MILYEQEARDYLKKGVDILANAVKVTLGPCGSNVIVYKNGIPHVTKDGVTVAKSINDEEYKVGIELVRKVSEKTGNDAGDGTTTSTLLTQSIVELVYEKLKANPNLKPIYIKKGIDLVVKKIVDELEQMSIPVEDRIKQVAYISSNGDEEITSVVTEVMNKVKGTGMISLKSSDSNTYVTYSEGLKWETPYMNPNFVTNAVKMEVEYENCKVIIFDKKLEKLTQILPVLEKCKRANVPVLICVKDIEQDCLNTLVMNNLNGILKCCVVKIPGHENYRMENILDLQSIIGNSELVDKVIVTRESTFFINNKGNEETKAARIASLKHNLTLTDPNIEDINKIIVGQTITLPNQYQDNLTMDTAQTQENIESETANRLVKGIDVSHHQGIIDWETVQQEIDYAIVRLCDFYHQQPDGTCKLDEQFENNIKKCEELNIPVGVYYYSHATTEEEAVTEARFVADSLKAYSLEYPVYMDIETEEQNAMIDENQQQMKEVIISAMTELESEGYFAGVYCNGGSEDNTKRKEFIADISKVYNCWLTSNATYNIAVDFEDFKAEDYEILTIPNDEIAMYQYSQQGQIDGISGNVDLNYATKELSDTIIEKGFSKIKQ